MIILNRLIIKKDNKYKLIGEIVNPSYYTIKPNKKLNKYKRVYRNCSTIFVDLETKEAIDYLDYVGCPYVNCKYIYSNEFLTSDFFHKNYNRFVEEIAKIYKNKKIKKVKILDLGKKQVYKVLNSNEFLTSDFAKKNYKNIYNTLSQVIDSKEKNKAKSLNYK